jgi:hypothetical protein
MTSDVEHSNTREYLYEINDAGFYNATTKTLHESKNSMLDIDNNICDDSYNLSNGADSIPLTVFQNIYMLCLEETDYVDSFIDLFSEGISDFQNIRKKYNGCFYCRYMVEDNDSIEKELLFVVKRK